jgi:hypothetical protein
VPRVARSLDAGPWRRARSLDPSQLVADPTDGGDDAASKLPSQVVDVRVHNSRIVCIREHLVQKIGARKHLSRPARQPLKEIALTFGEQHLVTRCDGRGARMHVQRRPRNPQNGNGRCDPPAKSSQPSEQLVDVEGFSEIVLGAPVQTLDPVGRVTKGGEHERRRLHARLSKLGQYVEALDDWQPAVEKQAVKRLGQPKVKRALTVARRNDGVTLAREELGEHHQKARIILNDKDARGVFHVRSLSSRRYDPVDVTTGGAGFGLATGGATTGATTFGVTAGAGVEAALGVFTGDGVTDASGTGIAAVWRGCAAVNPPANLRATV